MTNSDWSLFNGVAINSDGVFLAGSGNYSISDALNAPAEISITQFSPETIDALKNALGYGDVIVKCGWCGQYGAIKTTCKHCGQAIDPR